MAFIFYVSSVPGKDIPSLFPFQDILFHGGIYGILALFFYRALKNTNRLLRASKLIFFTAIFCFVYGASDELHQLYTSGRYCSGFDITIDTLGSLVGSLIARLFLR
jgi:VanZ family protein